jgi:tetratricopeptide (TPR) repeat protein
MDRRARIALYVAIAAGALAPADAQIIDNRLTLYNRVLAISTLEQTRLMELQYVLRSSNRGAQDQALAAARGAANTPDARLLLAVYQLEIGRQRQDDALRAPALDVLIANRDTPSRLLPGYLSLRGNIAFRNGDYATASSALTRLAELQPNDPQVLFNLAQLRNAQHDSAAAIDLIGRAIGARQGAAQPAPEAWYRQWVAIAHDGRLVDQGAAAGRALVAAYPTPDNWRFALVAYRQLAPPQDSAEIDLLRLMRAVGAFARPAEYQRLAQLLKHTGLLGEARAVIDDGIARGIVNRTESPTPEIIAEIDRAIARLNEPPPRRRRRPPAVIPAPAPPPSATSAADTLLSGGHYADAAAAYRALLQRGGADSAMVNTRLGVALVLGSQRGEAEAAFRAAAGPADAPAPAQHFYPDLARFWLAWLARSG